MCLFGLHPETYCFFISVGIMTVLVSDEFVFPAFTLLSLKLVNSCISW